MRTFEIALITPFFALMILKNLESDSFQPNTDEIATFNQLLSMLATRLDDILKYTVTYS